MHDVEFAIPISAEAGETLVTRGARDEAASAAAIARGVRAFMIGIRIGCDRAAAAIRSAAFFRRGARLAGGRAGIAAADSVDAIP